MATLKISFIKQIMIKKKKYCLLIVGRIRFFGLLDTSTKFAYRYDDSMYPEVHGAWRGIPLSITAKIADVLGINHRELF